MSTISQIAKMPAALPDAKHLIILTHEGTYRYITEQFVTHDYSRTELVSIAGAIRDYGFEVVKRMGDRCKNLKHFSIPYLVAALQNEGSEIIEQIRKENRLEALAAQTKPLELPAERPTNLSERLESFEEERRIENALKGKT